MNARERLGQLAISETGFVFDPATGSTFTANESALVVLRGLAAGWDRAAVFDALRERFDTRGFDLERDVAELLHVLRQQGLVDAQTTF